MVQSADIQEARPRFECVQCHSRFWLSLDDGDLSREITGFTMGQRDFATKGRVRRDPCPKCFKPVEQGLTDCPYCGVVVEKFRASMTFKEGIPPHSSYLETMWKRVISDYGNESEHVEFIKFCARERNLAYAAAVYGQMLKLMPADELTQKLIREVKAHAEVMIPDAGSGSGIAGAASAGTRARVERVPYSRLWQVPLLCATVAIGVGLFVPTFRNLVGLGVALLFLAIALQVHFRRR